MICFQSDQSFHSLSIIKRSIERIQLQRADLLWELWKLQAQFAQLLHWIEEQGNDGKIWKGAREQLGLCLRNRQTKLYKLGD